MKEYLEKSYEDALQIVRDLCAIPAPSGLEDERAKWCLDWFKSIGGNAFIDEAKNVICEYNVTDSCNVSVFMAHTDTVFPDTTPMPFFEDEDRMYSPGVCDDTGNLASMLIAARYVISNRIPTTMGLVFVANSCEEGLGNLKGSKAVLARYGSRIADFITVDGATMGAVVTKAVGSHRYEVTVRTEGGHSFAKFGNRNAIACLSSMISTLYSVKVPSEGDSKTTYNVGTITGGTSVNTIAQEATMLYEYRSDNVVCLEKMKDMFLKVVEAYRSTGLDIDVKMIGDRPCNSADLDMDRMNALVAKADDSIIRCLGKEPFHRSGSTDANTALGQGIPAICVTGATGGKCHTREEWLDKKSLLVGSTHVLDLLTFYFA